LQKQLLPIRGEVIDAISRVIDQASYINGAEVKSFAYQLAQWTNVKHVIPVANGTDGLQIAMMALDLRSGDEVIVPVFTYVATAEVIALLGLKPIFVDVDPLTFNIDCSDLESKISPRTKAIVPVHLFGQCANMKEILRLARKYNLFVIEDAAQAIGSVYQSGEKAGAIGDIGVTSFFPSKNLGCFGDGGAIFTNSDALAEKISMISNHGQKVKYYHDVVGVNSRLDTIQAAILNVKLKHLDTYIQKRQNLASTYDTHLSEMDFIDTPHRCEDSTHVFHQYTLKVHNGERDRLKSYLQDKGIPSMIYYPVPLHLQKAYAGLAKAGDFPISENLCNQVLSLPMHTEMSEDQSSYIIQSIKSFI
jgi:UDP-2-acetamido-2-deoxy-ribo-hexuluronate aminotransferase